MVYRKRFPKCNRGIYIAALNLVSFPEPPPKRKGGSGEYSTSSHYGLAVAMVKAKPLKSLAGLQ